MSLSLETLTSSFILLMSSVPNNYRPNYQDSKMKSGYKTIPEEEESKPLTKAGIAETGGSPIMKKYLVLVSLGLVIMGFLLMGHRTNTHHSGLRMSQESMTVQLVDSKDPDNVSTRSPP